MTDAVGSLLKTLFSCDPTTGEATPAPYGWVMKWDTAVDEYGMTCPVNLTMRPATKEEAGR